MVEIPKKYSVELNIERVVIIEVEADGPEDASSIARFVLEGAFEDRNIDIADRGDYDGEVLSTEEVE